MMDEQPKFALGDLVWAKMKGFSPWPGKVITPLKNMKRPKSNKPAHFIWFFGSKNFAWIEEFNIKTYVEFKDTFTKACKTIAFKEACAEIEEFIRKRDSGEVIDEFEFQDDDELDLEDDGDGGMSPSQDTTSPPSATTEKKTKLPQRRKKTATSSDVENGGTTSKTLTPTPKKRRTSTIDDVLNAAAPGVKGLNHTPRKTAVSNFLDRPTTVHRPDAKPLDVADVSSTLKEKKITPSNLKFGFLGLGIMGSGIVKNLLNSGHSVMVWNRTPDKCKQFIDVGAEQGMTPSDVISSADITFSCVSDPQAAKDMVFGNCGVLCEMSTSKGYVEMTGTDSETSNDIAEAIGGKGGRYLEAQIQGSKTEAEKGTLVIIAAGDRSLFEDSQSAFEAMGSRSFYLGEVGNASKMNLVLQLINGVALSALAEGFALADRAGLQQKDVLEILKLTSINSRMFEEKGQAIIDATFPTFQPLQHSQKDLNLALAMGHMLEQPLPLTATANEIYKHAKRLGYGEHDIAAVYIRARF